MAITSGDEKPGSDDRRGLRGGGAGGPSGCAEESGAFGRSGGASHWNARSGANCIWEVALMKRVTKRPRRAMTAELREQIEIVTLHCPKCPRKFRTMARIARTK